MKRFGITGKDLNEKPIRHSRAFSRNLSFKTDWGRQSYSGKKFGL